MRYIQPGAPPLPLPATQPNSYIQPSGPLQQPPSPCPQPIPQPLQARDHEPQPAGLLAAWRGHHADTWVRADALNPAVRGLIDPQDRVPAIRQKLPRLTSTHLGVFKLEARVVGNAARPVTLYRVIEVA